MSWLSGWLVVSGRIGNRDAPPTVLTGVAKVCDFQAHTGAHLAERNGELWNEQVLCADRCRRS